MQAPVRSGSTASHELMPDRRIEIGDSVNAEHGEIQRAMRVRPLVHHVSVAVADGALANAVAVDELESAQRRSGKRGAPSWIMTNLDSQRVAVNACNGVGKRRHLEAAECGPDHGNWREVVTDAGVCLAGNRERVADETREPASHSVGHKEIQTHAIGWGDAGGTIAL